MCIHCNLKVRILSVTATCTHTLTQTRTHTHAHTHTCTYTYIQMHIYTHANNPPPRTRIHTHMHTCARAYASIDVAFNTSCHIFQQIYWKSELHSHALTRIHTHARVRVYVRIRIHTRTSIDTKIYMQVAIGWIIYHTRQDSLHNLTIRFLQENESTSTSIEQVSKNIVQIQKYICGWQFYSGNIIDEKIARKVYLFDSCRKKDSISSPIQQVPLNMVITFSFIGLFCKKDL